MSAATEARPETPPYISYSTFANALASMAGKPLPSHIDKSLFKSTMSGSNLYAFMPALEFLGFVANGRPTPLFETFTSGTDEEKNAAMKKVLHDKFPKAYKILPTASPDAMKREFDYDAAEHVKPKCIAFFLAAARACGLTISPYILGATSVRKPRKKGGSPRRASAKEKIEAAAPKPHDPAPAWGATVNGLKRFPIFMGAKMWEIGIEENYKPEDVVKFTEMIKMALKK